jgi:hypothetical protein
VLGRALTREDKRGNKRGGHGGDEAPFIGDVTEGGWATSGEAWGQHSGQEARHGRQRPGREAHGRCMTSAEIGDGGG